MAKQSLAIRLKALFFSDSNMIQRSPIPMEYATSSTVLNLQHT